MFRSSTAFSDGEHEREIVGEDAEPGAESGRAPQCVAEPEKQRKRLELEDVVPVRHSGSVYGAPFAFFAEKVRNLVEALLFSGQETDDVRLRIGLDGEIGRHGVERSAIVFTESESTVTSTSTVDDSKPPAFGSPPDVGDHGLVNVASCRHRFRTGTRRSQ